MNTKWSRKHIFLAGVVFIVSFLFTLFATFFSSQTSGNFDDFFYGFLTPNVIALSLTCFILLQKLSEYIVGQKMKNFLHNVSKTVFGVYLIHIIILEILSSGWFGFRFGGFVVWQPFIAVPATAVIVFVISVGIIFLLQKIPYIRLVTGT